MARRTPVLAAFASLSVVAVPVPSHAQNAEILANACTSCHGVEGKSQGAIPSLVAVDAKVLADAFKAFATGARKGTVMNYVAKGYTDEQIAAISAYFAARK